MSKIVLIDFFAVWCSPCRMQDPILEDLKKKYEDKVEFRKIDVDKNDKIANKYDIRSIPTLIIEKDEKIFKKYIGVTAFKILEEDIIEALKQTENVETKEVVKAEEINRAEEVAKEEVTKPI